MDRRNQILARWQNNCSRIHRQGDLFVRQLIVLLVLLLVLVLVLRLVLLLVLLLLPTTNTMLS
jgi:hypothetical protein